MPFEFGDVVLVPFPFTNQTNIKQRPGVVVSGRAYNAAKRDIVLMAVTSQIRPSLGTGEIWVAGWQEAGLLKPSVIKPVMATIEQRLVIRRLGMLCERDEAALRAVLGRILG